MLLRCSSTPILGSLLSSCSDSPNNFDHSRPPSSDHHKKLSFIPHAGHASFHHFSCNSSPMSQSGSNGFRRVRSDGNLEGLPASELDELHISRRRHPVLYTIPSFSAYHSNTGEEEEEEEEEEVGDGDGLLRSVTIGDSITAVGQDFDFVDGKDGSLANQTIEEESEELILSINGIGSAASPLFLAGGIGTDTAIVNAALAEGDGACFRPMDSGGSGDGSDLEDHYRRLVEENPCSALCLRNYAQFLYQVKMDYPKAEEFYSRAILAEPGDGEVLSQYAKLIWDLHHDHDRAACYFEQAVQAAPNDSHVLAAYASFLWEAEEEEDEGEVEQESHSFMGAQVVAGSMVSTNV